MYIRCILIYLHAPLMQSFAPLFNSIVCFLLPFQARFISCIRHNLLDAEVQRRQQHFALVHVLMVRLSVLLSSQCISSG